MMKKIINAPINPGTEYGNYLGLTTDRFTANSYLWDMADGNIYISFIQSLEPGKGHFKELVNRLLSLGFTVNVPTPLGKMKEILKHLGFTESYLFEKELGAEIESWIKKHEQDTD